MACGDPLRPSVLRQPPKKNREQDAEPGNPDDPDTHCGAKV